MASKVARGGCALVAVLAVGLVVGPAFGQPAEEPVWEIGAVAGGGWLPDYPAADQNHVRGLVLPFAIYRGEIFRLGDRGAARGIVYDDRRLQFDLGLDAAFPVDSEDNDAREGMPDLDYLIELGPRVRWRFLPEPDGRELDLSLAVRGVISTDAANWRYQGITVNPALTWRVRPFETSDLRLIAGLRPLFGLDGLNGYFYEVRPQYATEERRAYDADDGYIGTELNLGLSWSVLERVRLFGGVQLGYWGHAANDDSPLHRDDLTAAVGGGLRVAFFRSEHTLAGSGGED
jgi:hypothetical protein